MFTPISPGSDKQIHGILSEVHRPSFRCPSASVRKISAQESSFTTDSQVAILVLGHSKPSLSHYLLNAFEKQLRALQRKHDNLKITIAWIQGTETFKAMKR
jgi:hypothetical protein